MKMKKLDMSDIRRKMYATQIKKKSTEKKSETPIVSADRTAIVFENSGNRISVPTMESFQKMQSDLMEAQREIQRLKSQLKTVTDGANIMVREINAMSDELKGKIDKVSDD